MKDIKYIIIILWIVAGSCRTTTEKKLDCIKIAPIGISDVPRDTLYFSVEKIQNPVKINLEDDKLSCQIITDVNTLSKMETFARKNDYNKNRLNKDFNEYGCFNIAGYSKDSMRLSYNLSRLDSEKYLKSLIDMLITNKLDTRVIKSLKEQCLNPIDY